MENDTTTTLMSYIICCLPVCFLGMINIAVICMAHASDTRRIREYLSARDAVLLAKQWTPFGPGWLGGNKVRIYRIRYCDQFGQDHTAYCKTGMFAGVYLSEDEIVQAH